MHVGLRHKYRYTRSRKGKCLHNVQSAMCLILLFSYKWELNDSTVFARRCFILMWWFISATLHHCWSPMATRALDRLNIRDNSCLRLLFGFSVQSAPLINFVVTHQKGWGRKKYWHLSSDNFWRQSSLW